MQEVTSPEKAKPGSSLFPMEGLLGFSLRDQALDGAPALAVDPFPASQRPVRIQLGTLNSRAFWPPTAPTLHPTAPGVAPEPPASVTVVPLSRGQRYYGEAPARVWWGYGGISGL